MASIKMKFRPSTCSDRAGVIYFQIIHRRSVRQVLTIYRVRKEEWPAMVQPISIESLQLSLGRKVYLTKVLENVQNEQRLLRRIINELERSAEAFTVDSIVNAYKERVQENTLGLFMRSIINQLQQNGQRCTARNYLATLRSFMRFRSEVDVPLDMLNVDMILAYEAWLKQQGLCRNTSSFYMRQLRAVYNRACEKGLVCYQHLFRRVYTGVDKTRKRAVGLEVIQLLRRLNLSERHQQAFARDVFLLSFCLRGISFIDLAKLRKSDIRDGYLHYTRSKTRQSLCVKWEPIMQEVVERYAAEMARSEYLLPILHDAPIYNKEYHNAQNRISYHLKKLSSTLDLQKHLTLYVARHSWASIARDSSVPISVISEALGHDSEQTTQIYLQSIQASEVDRANASILEML